MADLISRLKLESGEFDSKIKRAGQELLAYSEHCKKMGLEMGYANRDAKEFAKALGSMQTVSQTARGKINELSEAFVNAKVMYKNMTDEEKKSVFGKNLATSLDQLKVRLNAAKQDLADVNKELAGSGSGGGKFGGFGNVIDTLGQKLGLTTNATELLTSKTALMYAGIGAGVAVVTKATDAWAKYNAELSKQDQVTQVTTGLKGPDANRMTDVARAMVDTYKVDFREAINAANTLMTQFGTTGDEAMKLIKDGMQGMIQGDGPKLLTMIQQYAPAFRDAGISASQLVAVVQNSEGGIFTDQNMNAIVMGIKNIRLMTKATSDALARLGIDGQKMSKQLSDGTLTIFEALKQVSGQLKNTEAGSQAAGEVMQQVFGRQGVTAGTNLAKAIETLNTNLDETKRQTGELGDAFAELQTANEKLNTAIREAFSYDGWEQMATGIKSKLITALATVIEQLGKIRQWFSDFTPSGQTENIQTAEQKDMNRRLAYVRSGNNKQYWNQQNKEYYDQQVSERQFKVSALKGDDSITKGLRQKAEADLQAWKNLRDEYNKKANDILTAPPKSTTQNKITPITPTTENKATKKEQTELQKNQSKINELTQEYVKLGNESTEAARERQAEIQKEIALLEKRNGLLGLRAEQAQGRLLSNDDMKRKAEIDIQANTKQIEDLRKQLTEIEGVTIDPKSVTVTATDKALPKLREIEGITIDDKTMTVTAETADALRALQGIEGVTIDPKSVTVTATDKALPKLREIEGITIDDKTMTVTAETADALRALQGIEGVTVDPKTIEVTANTSEAQQKIDELKAKIAELEGKNINIQAFVESIEKPLGEGLNKTPGTLLKAPATAVYENGAMTEKAVPRGGLQLDDKAMKAVQKNIEKQQKSDEKKEVSLGKEVSNIAGGVSGMFSGLQQLGIELPEGLQGVLNGITGVTQILTSIMTIVTAIEAIAGADTLLPFARGGIVPHAAGGYFVGGTHFSGDVTPIMANAGELVLNKAQQGVLASELQGGGMQNLNLTATIKGEQIRLALNNNGRRTGRGEYVQSRNVR